MRRGNRGNKSRKVPNVKLRPPEPSGAKSSLDTPQSSFWVQDTQPDNQDAGNLDLCPRPFKGVVLCATGIVDKPTLFRQALELGATTSGAFTDKVTHLVASDHGGAKYTCALERKMPILKPSWITESYQTWLRGDDVDLAESISSHLLPIFSDICLSLSGIASITRRTQINKLLTHHGGTYIKNLERPVKVTHLLCSGDGETEKMKYAEKFNRQGEAMIWLVWEEWFWDSLDFGGRFQEEKYQVRLPRPERRSRDETSNATPQPGADEEESSSPPRHAPPKPKPKPNAPTTDDALDEEPASVKRVPAETLQMWSTLLKPRGFEISAGKLIRSPSKSQSRRIERDEIRGNGIRESGSGGSNESGSGSGKSVIDMVRRGKGFVSKPKEGNGGRQPFQRIHTSGSIFEKGEACGDIAGQGSVVVPQSSPPSGSRTLFTGLKFRALGEARCVNVRSAVEGCGGRIMVDEEADEEVDYIVVRLVSGSKIYREEGDDTERNKFRTECWLERCIFEERICLPEEHVSFTPLKIQIPVPGAELVNLSFSGLDESEACWVRRLIRALGVNLTPNFSRRSTHLLCPSGTGAKFEKAREWGIPVVDMGWLGEMASAGFIPDADRHKVVEGMEMDILPVHVPKSAKAKGKEREDHGMVDITNISGPPREVGASQFIDRPNENAESGEAALVLTQKDPHLFGEPNGILSPTPTNRSKTLDRESRARSGVSSPGPSPSRHLTLEEIQRDMRETQIPSSKSPSPLKVPSDGSPRSSSSPMKLPNVMTKALQDSITTLLGKRSSEEAEEEIGLPAPQTRLGKRARAQGKSKPQSRQGSGELQPVRQKSITVPAPGLYELPHIEADDELNITDGNLSIVDHTVRVMYEDPGQREEKKRLMSLFESSHGEGGKGKGMMRRSTRMAGF